MSYLPNRIVVEAIVCSALHISRKYRAINTAEKACAERRLGG
jgi:hypothetical protein